jgi:hypothetical protein
MAESEIPEDINEVAGELLRQAITISRSRSAAAGIAMISTALMVERHREMERCAALAESLGGDIIASAIRQEHPNET